MPFNLDEYMIGFNTEYYLLPDIVDETDIIHKPSKETVPDPVERRKILEVIIDDVKLKTACASCPFDGICNRLNHNTDKTFVQVTGCSQHPDQETFRGHSTTVTITDVTKSGSCRHGWVTTGWDSCHDAVSSSTTDRSYCHNGINRDYGGDKWYIYRSMMLIDTSSIPTGSIIQSAIFKLYVYALPNPCFYPDDRPQVLDGGGTKPSDPIVSGDYLYTQYSGNYGVTSAAPTYSTQTNTSYNNFPLSDFSKIPMGAGALFRCSIHHPRDVSDEPPTPSENTQDYVACHGSANTYPPKLELTYDVSSSIGTMMGAMNWGTPPL